MYGNALQYLMRLNKGLHADKCQDMERKNVPPQMSPILENATYETHFHFFLHPFHGVDKQCHR